MKPQDQVEADGAEVSVEALKQAAQLTGRLRGKVRMMLKDGYDWNPLRGWPPNAQCFCGEPFKAKKHCLPRQPEAILSADAKAIREAMKLGEPGLQAIRNKYLRHKAELTKVTQPKEPTEAP